jgi:hypothetical protein
MKIYQSRSFEKKVKKFKEESLELIMIGPHENYYRDLEAYLKSKQKPG